MYGEDPIEVASLTIEIEIDLFKKSIQYVGVSKLQVASLARSSREMYQTVRID